MISPGRATGSVAAPSIIQIGIARQVAIDQPGNFRKQQAHGADSFPGLLRGEIVACRASTGQERNKSRIAHDFACPLTVLVL